MTIIPTLWKLRAAKLVRIPFVNQLMIWGVQLVVPRHRVGAIVVVLDDNGRILLLKHVFHPHAPWGLPGGWLKRNEDPATAVLRELKEETGLTAVLGPVILITHQTTPHHIGIAYAAQVVAGEITLSPEIIEARWFSPEEIPSPILTFRQEAINTAVEMHRNGRWPLAVQPRANDNA